MHVVAPLGHTAQAVDLEAEQGERAADAVVELAGDPASLLVGADRAEPAEQAGVVDGDPERLDDAVDRLAVLGREVAGRLASTAMSPTSEPRARSDA